MGESSDAAAISAGVPVPSSRRRDTMVLVMTWAASGMDAISYLGLGHVFTANMTGNAVLLGLAVGQRQGYAALRSTVALIGFVLGVAIAALIMELAPKHGEWPQAVTAAVILEWVILAVFTIFWHLLGGAGEPVYVLIALAAVAMGIQSAAVRQLKVPGIATTYITGTLTSTVAGFVGWLQLVDTSAATTDKSPAQPAPFPERKRGARLQAAVVIIYFVVAMASGYLQFHRSRLVTISPLLAVTLVVANAVVRHRQQR